MKHSGFCKKCGKHFHVPPEIDDKESNSAYCPDCGGPLYLQYKSLEAVIKEIGLSKSEIGHGVASVH